MCNHHPNQKQFFWDFQVFLKYVYQKLFSNQSQRHVLEENILSRKHLLLCASSSNDNTKVYALKTWITQIIKIFEIWSFSILVLAAYYMFAVVLGFKKNFGGWIKGEKNNPGTQICIVLTWQSYYLDGNFFISYCKCCSSCRGSNAKCSQGQIETNFTIN